MKTLQKIAVWGDSILKGIIQNGQNADNPTMKQYSAIPDNALYLSASRFNIEITNHCYFGCTCTKGKLVLERDLKRGIDCDTGIIEFGGNDCDYDWAVFSNNPDSQNNPHTPLDIFIQTMQEMIDTLRKNYIRPVLMTLPPLVADCYYRTICRGLNHENIMHWLGDAEYLYRWHEMYSAEIGKLAAKNNCFLVDMRKAFLREHNYQRLMCSDGIHPNEEGHKFMSSVFEEAVLESGRPLPELPHSI